MCASNTADNTQSIVLCFSSLCVLYLLKLYVARLFPLQKLLGPITDPSGF